MVHFYSFNLFLLNFNIYKTTTTTTKKNNENSPQRLSGYFIIFVKQNFENKNGK